MHHLIELYDIASLNDAALCEGEKAAIIQARLALRMFVRAMERFKRVSAEVSPAPEADLAMAA